MPAWKLDQNLSVIWCVSAYFSRAGLLSSLLSTFKQSWGTLRTDWCRVLSVCCSPLNIPSILIHVMYHANNCLVCHTFDPQYHHMVPATVPSWSASSIPIWCSWQHNKIHQTYLCEPIRWWGRKCGFNNGVCNKAVQSVNIFNKLSFLPSYQHKKIKMWLWSHSCCNVEQCLNEHS